LQGRTDVVGKDEAIRRAVSKPNKHSRCEEIFAQAKSDEAICHTVRGFYFADTSIDCFAPLAMTD
jgi:hypothetical protein